MPSRRVNRSAALRSAIESAAVLVLTVARRARCAAAADSAQSLMWYISEQRGTGDFKLLVARDIRKQLWRRQRYSCSCFCELDAAASLAHKCFVVNVRATKLTCAGAAPKASRFALVLRVPM